MQRKKWMFWLHNEEETQTSSSSSLIEDGACHEWTPFLTALFDGEASEQNALQARHHLLVCERCARAWFDWNQTRNLLQNQSAPPPPPSLLWRIRLACRLGHPALKEAQTPDLGGQILALTTRSVNHPSWQEQLGLAFRGLRVHTSLAGAMALGAFALLLSRDGVLPGYSSFVSSSTPLRTRSAAMLHRSTNGGLRSIRSRAKTPFILAPHARRVAPVEELRLSRPEEGEENSSERSLVTLARARRERETLGEQSVRLASYDESEPLPMLEAPRPKPLPVQVQRKAAPHRTIARARLASLDDVTPSPIASSPVAVAPRGSVSTPPIVLASYSPTSDVAQSSIRMSRPSSTSPLNAPLRISAPHALPITMSQPSATNDSDLDELDSTVQQYRATFADSDDSNYNDAN